MNPETIVLLAAGLFAAAAIAVAAVRRKLRWSLKAAERKSGEEFEKFVARVFVANGYKCEFTKASGDQGIDLLVRKRLTKIGIQVKKYSRPVGNAAVQEAVAGKKFYKTDKVAVVTNNRFTRSAIALAEANGVELIDRDGLEILIENAKRKNK